MKANYPYRIDEANGISYTWFTRMEYRGGTVMSDLWPKLTLFEDKYYDISTSQELVYIKFAICNN